MANTFHDLSTSSPGEVRDYQSNRAKDGFYKLNKPGYNGPDAARIDGPKPTQNPPTDTNYSPQLQPDISHGRRSFPTDRTSQNG